MPRSSAQAKNFIRALKRMEIQGNRKIIPNAFDRTFRDFFFWKLLVGIRLNQLENIR